MSVEKENRLKNDDVFQFSVWKTNIVLTFLFILGSLFLVDTSELTSVHNQVLIESILFNKQYEMTRSMEIVLSTIALLSIALSSILFVFFSWNNVIAKIANCRRISIGQAYALLIIASGVVSAVYRL